MGACLSCCKKSNGNSGSLQEPLYTANKRQSDDISLAQNALITSKNKSYDNPTLHDAISEEDVDVHVSPSDDPLDAESFSDEAIPPMGQRASLTGWLYYRTGTLFTSYQRAFFVLQEGYIYAYKRPKSDASNAQGNLQSSSPSSISYYFQIDMLFDPLDLVGGVCDKLSLPERPYCIDVRGALVLDAFSGVQQKLW